MATLKEGWLTKQGGSIKTWKKRWMTLKNGGLYYAKTQSTSAIGVINLSNSLKIVPVALKGKKNCFEIDTPDRTYYLIAESEGERDSWVEKLNQERETVKGGRTSSMPPKVTDKVDASAHSRSATVMATGSPGTKAASPPPAPERKLTVEDFDLLKVIGKGSFGKVFQVRKKDNGKIYAMKVLDKKVIVDRNEVEHTKAERSILEKLVHPFLMTLYFSFQTPEKLYFVMDYVNGGELFFHLQKDRRFSEERTRFYCAEIACGLEFLHNAGVIYRDLKPENILLTDEGHICLTDFGIAKQGLKEGDRTETFCGTPEYLAPEILEGVAYDKSVDWWSYGTLMFEMLVGLPPFYSQNIQEMYMNIISAPLEIPPSVSADAGSLISQLLERDTGKRLTDAKLIKAHRFFKSIDFEKLVQKEITPPYIPPVRSKNDTNMVDPTFTTEEVSVSPTELGGVAEATGNFEGFTFVPDSGLNA